MNTKPRAKRFRVRRSMSLEERERMLQAAREQAKAAKAQPKPAAPAAEAPPPAAAVELTARQLRLARRLAERRGLKVSSDQEAIEALRARGIDPFAPNRLQVVPGPRDGAETAQAPEAAPAKDTAAPAQGAAPAEGNPPGAPGAPPVPPATGESGQPAPAPAEAKRLAPPPPESDADTTAGQAGARPAGARVPAPAGPAAPPPALQPAAKPPGPVDVPNPNDAAKQRHAAEIMAMQAQIARRRRLKLLSLGVRLAVFVLLPTILAAYYFAVMATPMYSTHSSFYIQKAEPAVPGGAGGLLSGTPLANTTDSISVQDVLLSLPTMIRLDDETGYRAAFQAPSIDALQRLDTDATTEAAFRHYKRMVKIGYDPSEGIIRMEVVAPDPELGVRASEALLTFAAEHVDTQTKDMRRDRMAGAQESLDDAEAKMREAQERVLSLQEARGVLSADAEVSSLMNQISTFEVELKQEQLALQSLLDNTRPNQTKVDVARRNIARLEALIADMRSQMTEGNAGNASLARITGELVIAEAELETRQSMMGAALQALEAARIEANRQASYLIQNVAPTASDEPSYPRVFENTLLAFLFFGGIYLMISLTAAILREQVSS